VAIGFSPSFFGFNPLNARLVNASVSDWQGGFLASQDAGATWTTPSELPFGGYIYPGDYVFHPSFSNIVFSVGNHYTYGEPFDDVHVLWSNASGRAPWNMTSSVGNGWFNAVALDKNNPSILYAAGILNSEATKGVYRFRVTYNGSSVASVSRVPGTFDAGLTDVSINQLLYDGVNAYLYASTPSGIFRSQDQAATWSSISSTELPGVSTTAMAVTPDGKHLLVGTGSGIWQFTDTPPQTPVVGISPSNLKVGFRDQPFGTTSSPRPVILSNRGQGLLTITGLAFSGPNAADFLQATNTCGDVLPAQLPSNGSCTINVAFSPSVLGDASATLTITDDDNGISGSHQILNLTAHGGPADPDAAAMTLSPESASFDDPNCTTTSGFSCVFVGTASPAKTFTLTNTGTAPLGILSISFGTPVPTNPDLSDFVQSSDCPVSPFPARLAPNTSCAIKVVFNPSAQSGFRSAQLTVSGTASNSPVNATVTGTSVFPATDSDEDGIFDIWETEGLMLHGVKVDLPAMGADPHRKDIFVQIDHLNCIGPCPTDPRTGNPTTPHNHIPNLDAMKKVIAAFDSAPVVAVPGDPLGKPGINLHVDWGSNAIMRPAPGKTWADCLSDPNDLPDPAMCKTWGNLSQATEIAETNVNFDLGCTIISNPNPPPPFACDKGFPVWNFAFNAIKNVNSDSRRGDLSFSLARRPVFHYGIFGHGYHFDGDDPAADTSSGSSVPTSNTSPFIPSSDFLVTLGFFRDPQDQDVVGSVIQQAGTFMHELGHNLGLNHGGPPNDYENYKPNYLSVMNYSFQTRGLIVDGPGCAPPCEGQIDYSRFAPPSIDEQVKVPTHMGLNETLGLNGGDSIQSYGTRYYCVDSAQSPPHIVDRIVPPPTTAPNANDMINGPIDWNCDGRFESMVQADIDKSLKGNTPVFSTLSSYQDWPNLIFRGGNIGTVEPTATGQSPILGSQANSATVSTQLPPTELTFQEDAELTTLRAVSVRGPGDMTLPPGENTVLSFVVTNKGTSEDTFTLDATSDQPWADLTALRSTKNVNLAPKAAVEFDIRVRVPASAGPGLIDHIVVKATSQASPLVLDSARPTVATPGADLVCGAIDIGSLVRIRRGLFRRVPGASRNYSQLITARNVRSVTIPTPIFLVVGNLGTSTGDPVNLVGDQLVSHCESPVGSYLIPLTTAGEGLGPGQKGEATLVFSTLSSGLIDYKTRVLSGMPSQ
jgi:hypothetical protein